MLLAEVVPGLICDQPLAEGQTSPLFSELSTVSAEPVDDVPVDSAGRDRCAWYLCVRDADRTEECDGYME